MSTKLFPVQIGAEEGKVVVETSNDAGEQFRIELPPMDCQNLVGAMTSAFQDAVGHPMAESRPAAVHHFQLEETSEILFFRIYVSPSVFHEYALDRDATIAQDLLEAFEKNADRKVARAPRPPSGSIN